MNQPPKWRTFWLKPDTRILPGNRYHRVYDEEQAKEHQEEYDGEYGPPTGSFQVIELSCVKDLVDALKRIASAESFVGYAFDGNHQFKSLFDEMVLRRKLAEDTLAKLPAEVLGE